MGRNMEQEIKQPDYSKSKPTVRRYKKGFSDEVNAFRDALVPHVTRKPTFMEVMSESVCLYCHIMPLRRIERDLQEEAHISKEKAKAEKKLLKKRHPELKGAEFNRLANKECYENSEYVIHTGVRILITNTLVTFLCPKADKCLIQAAISATAKEVTEWLEKSKDRKYPTLFDLMNQFTKETRGRAHFPFCNYD